MTPAADRRIDRQPYRSARVFFYGLVLVSLLLVTAPALGLAQETEIVGTVSDVDGTRVTIPLPDGPLPHVGDAVTLSQEVPGVGAVPVDGEWIVTDVTLDQVVATAWGDAAKPQPGQQATIRTTEPRRRVEAETDLELLAAAAEGSPAGIHAALGEGANIDVRGRMGATPLMMAITDGHDEAVRMLLDQDADVTVEAFGGQTALGVAAAQGHSEIVSLLLDAGADPNHAVASELASDDMRGATPLILAAQFGHTGPIPRLLYAGADANHRTPAGMTALMYAAQHGDAGAVESRGEVGADPNMGRPDGLTPLFSAAVEGAVDVVRVLVDGGADLEQALPDSVPEPYAGMTPLLAAASQGRANVVTALLDMGADPEVRNTAGDNALALATAGGHDEVVEVLRNPRAALADARNQLGEALIEAARDGDVDGVRRLLQAGADANAVRADEEAGTALMFAAQQNAFRVIELLLQHGADVNAVARGDEGGYTALMLAAWSGAQETVVMLLDAGADRSIAMPDGNTAASLARAEGHEEIARLIESGGR